MKEPMIPVYTTPHSINLYYSRLRAYQVSLILERLFQTETTTRYSDDMPNLYRASEIKDTAGTRVLSDGMSRIVRWIDGSEHISDNRAIWGRMEQDYPQEARALYLHLVSGLTLAEMAAHEGYSTRYASKLIQRGTLRYLSFIDARSYTRDVRDRALDTLASLHASPDAGYDAALADD